MSFFINRASKNSYFIHIYDFWGKANLQKSFVILAQITKKGVNFGGK